LPQVLAVPGIRMTETVGIYISFIRRSCRAAEAVIHPGLVSEMMGSKVLS